MHVQEKSRKLTAYAAPLAADIDARTGASRRQLQRTLSLVLPDAAGLVAARARQGGVTVPQQVDYGNVFRVFAGQPDPADPTHFTIPYEVDGHAGVIDGWLKEDRIELRPREGQWLYDKGETWRLTPRSATRPTIYPPAEGDAPPASPGPGDAELGARR